MKLNKQSILLVLCALCICAAVTVGVYGATQNASTTLVSLDYVENNLKPWVQEQVNGADGSYTVVYLTRGQRLMPTDSAELVIRSGKVNAISPFTTQGLSDMTAGAELYDGQQVAVNHQVIVPRGDGRGIIVVSDKSYVMVRGPYTIE